MVFNIPCHLFHKPMCPILCSRPFSHRREIVVFVSRLARIPSRLSLTCDPHFASRPKNVVRTILFPGYNCTE